MTDVRTTDIRTVGEIHRAQDGRCRECGEELDPLMGVVAIMRISLAPVGDDNPAWHDAGRVLVCQRCIAKSIGVCIGCREQVPVLDSGWCMECSDALREELGDGGDEEALPDGE